MKVIPLFFFPRFDFTCKRKRNLIFFCHSSQHLEVLGRFCFKYSHVLLYSALLLRFRINRGGIVSPSKNVTSMEISAEVNEIKSSYLPSPWNSYLEISPCRSYLEIKNEEK